MLPNVVQHTVAQILDGETSHVSKPRDIKGNGRLQKAYEMGKNV